MTDEMLLKSAKRYVMGILVKSDKTEAELRSKLKKKGYDDETAEGAIEYVKSFHYIDELRTAENYIRSRMNENSEKEIRYKLSGKGISEETIDMAYDRIMESDEIENTEAQAALNFVRKKLGSRFSDETELQYEEKQKLMAAAFRKGFKQESIREALKMYL